MHVVQFGKSSAVAEMGDRGHNRYGPKSGRLCPFLGELGSRLIQCDEGRGVYFRTKCRLHTSSRLATIDMSQKLGAGSGCALLLGITGSSSNTKSPGPRPTSIPSGILVHPDVWPQRTLAEYWGAVSFLGELRPHLI